MGVRNWAVTGAPQRLRNDKGDLTNRAGETLDITITSCVTFGSDTSAALVGRDSPQAATRINHATCTNLIPKRDGTLATVSHCGAVSEWDVLSGGRMGQVMGEDSTEVAPPATFCTEDCQAQNQVGGKAVGSAARPWFRRPIASTRATRRPATFPDAAEHTSRRVPLPRSVRRTSGPL
jgi:hypothetical protein